MSTHEERVKAVLTVALIEATRGHAAASGALIRERAESCLASALATCKEDRTEMYIKIDEIRKQ